MGQQKKSIRLQPDALGSLTVRTTDESREVGRDMLIKYKGRYKKRRTQIKLRVSLRKLTAGLVFVIMLVAGLFATEPGSHPVTVDISTIVNRILE